MSRHPSLEEIEKRFIEREARQRESTSPVPPPSPSPAPVVPDATAEHVPDTTATHTQTDVAEHTPDTTGVDAAPGQVVDSDPQATIAELREQLRQEQHARTAMQGRLAPTQQDLANMRQVLELRESESAEKDARLAELQAQLAQTQQADADTRMREAVLAAMSDEEREAYDDGFIDLVSRVALVAAKTATPATNVEAEVARALKQQEDERLQDYRAQVITDPESRLSTLNKISAEPRFVQWLEERPELNYHLTGLVNARTRKDINKFAKAAERHLQDYYDHVEGEQPNRTTPAVDPTPAADLERAMNRRQNGPRTQEAEAKIIAQINELSRSRSRADRDKALELISQL